MILWHADYLKDGRWVWQRQWQTKQKLNNRHPESTTGRNGIRRVIHTGRWQLDIKNSLNGNRINSEWRMAKWPKVYWPTNSTLTNVRYHHCMNRGTGRGREKEESYNGVFIPCSRIDIEIRALDIFREIWTYWLRNDLGHLVLWLTSDRQSRGMAAIDLN